MKRRPTATVSLSQRTKGETQLRATKWLSATNGWEVWRQLNLSFLSTLLDSLLHVSFDESPASCLQQVLAWKERVALYQKLSGEQLSEAIMMSALLNGLTETTRLHLLLHLDGDSSFGDLETLLARQLARQDFSLDKEELEEQDKPDQLVKGGKGEGAYNPQPPAYRGKGEPNQLPDSAHRACKGKPKGKGQESDPSFKRELEHRGKQGRQNEHRKGKGEAYNPQPHACKGKGKQHQLPKRYQWCDICWKTGHMTQACWWNPINQQQEQQHQQPARNNLEHQMVQASVQRRQPQIFRIDQRTACASLIPDTLPVLSLELRRRRAVFTVQNAQKQKGHFLVILTSRFFPCFLGFRWHLRYCHVASPLKISPTHPMLETTTGWENSCAPLTLNSFGRNRVSSSSWSFSAVVCESFVFEPCIILFQWRAEFFVAFVLVRVSPLQSVLSLFCWILSPVGSLNLFFFLVVAYQSASPQLPFVTVGWGRPPPERWYEDGASKKPDRDIITAKPFGNGNICKGCDEWPTVDRKNWSGQLKTRRSFLLTGHFSWFRQTGCLVLCGFVVGF